ncbi:MAG: ABC transporter ATP-binding protein [Bacillota bacterium]
MYDIELRSVSKTYAGTRTRAVQDLSLAVEKGDIVTLLGPSGCGKTTTLRLIAGFEWADKGIVALGGRVVGDANTWVPPEKRGAGMVFQDYALFPHLNVFNNVGFGYKGKDRLQRIMEVLELVDLRGYEKRYPHQLSGGQQQRVALARALARRPVVVLLDEPFSNLDADMRTHMRAEIKRIIKETRTTAVFVSHDQKDALAISDRIVVMRDGAIQQTGTPREIYQFSANRFVATFVGTTNILEGKMAPGGQSVVTDLGEIPCTHTHGLTTHQEVFISIRPDSLERAYDGPIKGRVKEYTYTGKAIDATIEAQLPNAKTKDLLVHLHPEEVVQVGDVLSFTVLPNFVAVLRRD